MKYPEIGSTHVLDEPAYPNINRLGGPRAVTVIGVQVSPEAKHNGELIVKFHEENGRWREELLSYWNKHIVPAPTMRPSWDDYFIQMCHLVSTRATCDRKHVGAVLVRDRRALCTGYNGAVAGEAHCDQVGHDLVTLADGSVNCVRAAHAEMNCIAQAAQYGISLNDTTVYVNTFPCWNCARMLVSVGVRRVVFDSDYRNDPRVTALCSSRGVSLERWGG